MKGNFTELGMVGTPPRPLVELVSNEYYVKNQEEILNDQYLYK